MAKKEPLYPHVPKSKSRVPGEKEPEYITVRLQKGDWITTLEALDFALRYVRVKDPKYVEWITGVIQKIRDQLPS